LTEIVSVARQTFPKSIEIVLDINTADLCLVQVDPTQIHQVLMNLFVNARDALPAGGVITATADNVVINDTNLAQHLQAQVGSYVMITVADSGIGITSEVLDRIFEPFFTTKEVGTGLGLSTVLGIVKAHGGFINVESELNRGSCFQIYLPALANSEAEQHAERAAVADGRGRLVLVVDDELAVRQITKESLEAYNYRVLLASDGVEAIATYVQEYAQIAVVLLDMMMPHLDTPATMRALQRINPAVKMIVMSGLATNQAAIAGQGAQDFLTKPFTTADLLQVLEQVIK
jgi:CheY-like chemotaxis protein